MAVCFIFDATLIIRDHRYVVEGLADYQQCEVFLVFHSVTKAWFRPEYRATIE